MSLLLSCLEKKKAWEENKNENKSDIMEEPCGNAGRAFS